MPVRIAAGSAMSSRLSGVRTAIMPQPMSTPTAAGMMEPLVGSTVPTVAPLPKCTSGITATCLKMNGIEAVFSTCLSACSSTVSGGTNNTAFSETRYILPAYTGFTPIGYIDLYRKEDEERMMLLIREIFFCKPGQVRPMVEKFKTMNAVSERLGMAKVAHHDRSERRTLLDGRVRMGSEEPPRFRRA